MYSKAKKYTCVFLALVLCFCAFADVLTMPAEATPAIVVAAGAVVVWIFGLLGLHFASMNAANDAAEAFYNSDTTIKTDVDTLVGALVLNGTSVKFKITLALLPVVKRLIVSAKEFFSSDKADVEIPADYYTHADFPRINIYSSNSTVLGEERYLNSSSCYTLYSVGGWGGCDNFIGFNDIISFGEKTSNGWYKFSIYSVNVNGVDFSYSLGANPEYLNRGFALKIYSSSNGSVSQVSGYLTDVSCTDWSRGLSIHEGDALGYRWVGVTIGGYDYLVPVFVLRHINTSGIAEYTNLKTWFQKSCVPAINAERVSPVVNNIPYSNIGIDFTSLTAAIDRLIQTMTETQETILDLSDVYNALTDTAEGTEEDEETAKVPYVPSLEWLKQILRDLGLTLDEIKAITEVADPDLPYKPSVGSIPSIGNTWNYVKEFLKDALIWMKLWFSGFVLLPPPVQTSLWALLIIAVVLGLLKVFLQ